jgi:hypothetical protein
LSDHLYTVRQTNDGGYVLGGSSQSGISGDKTEENWNPTSNSFDCWVLKTDSSGNILWQKTIGGSGVDELFTFELTSDGGFILGASSGSDITGNKNEFNQGVNEFWILKIDSLGNFQWQNTIGGNDNESVASIQQIDDNGYLLAGTSPSNRSGDKTKNKFGGYDFWVVFLTTRYNHISGNVFIDANSNGSMDGGEPALKAKTVLEPITDRIAFTQADGSYRLAVLDSGNFSAIPLSTINYFNCIPSIHNTYFPGFQQTDSLNDFAFQPAGAFNDLCLKITPLGAFRSGFAACYDIAYQNLGTTILSPTILFFPDDNVDFVSSSPAANSVTPDSVVWNFGPLEPYQSGSILVSVDVLAALPIGSLVNSWARIEPVAGDANPACNQAYWEVWTTGSFDPNDILVDRYTLFTSEFPNPPFLDYIIRFQNTGNDTAFNVKILNPIDTIFLKLNTLEFVASSHPMDMNFIYHERNMEFRFDNILLPDSNVNEPASHGFVRYRIQPQDTLVLGDQIKNFAAIYFDFNEPVMTNTAVTEVVLPTGIDYSGPKAEGIMLYPNPAGDELVITVPGAHNAVLTVQDLAGRQVMQLPMPGKQLAVDIRSLPQGIYILRVRTDSGAVSGKFVRQ